MTVFDKAHLEKARAEGRICAHCGWMVNKKRWKNGKRLCASCEDALKGVNVDGRWGPYLDEPRNKTGEM